MKKAIRLSQQQLRELIKEAAEQLDQRGTFGGFDFEPSGSERKIRAAGDADKRWKKFSSDLGMVISAAQKAKEAAMDDDESTADRFAQQVVKFAKLAAQSLLASSGVHEARQLDEAPEVPPVPADIVEFVRSLDPEDREALTDSVYECWGPQLSDLERQLPPAQADVVNAFDGMCSDLIQALENEGSPTRRGTMDDEDEGDVR